MRLKSLRVKNWCQFQDLEVEFGEFTSIRGPIGTGKTNLVNALVFAFTGKTRSPGKIEENICQFAAPKEDSGVWVEFEPKPGVHCELYRGLSPKKRYLTVQGNERIESDKGVTAELERLLGVDQHILLEYIFVPQWGMFSFISQKDVERAKAFGRLFGTEQAEDIWNLLRDPPLPTATISVDIAAVNDSIKRIQREQEELEVETRAAKTRAAFLQDNDARHEEIIKAYQQRQLLGPSLAKLKKQVDQLAHMREQARIQLEYAAKQVSKTRGIIEEGRLKVHEARNVLQSWTLYEQWQEHRSNADIQLQKARESLSKLDMNKPNQPQGYMPPGPDRKKAEDRLREYDSRKSQLRSFINSCDPGRGVAACPTCGSSTEYGDLAERLADAKKEEIELESHVITWRERLAVISRYDYSLGYWTQQKETLQKHLDSWEAFSNRIKPQVMPELDRKEANELLKQHESLQALLTAQEKEQSSWHTKEATLAGQLGTLRTQVGEAEAQLIKLLHVSEEEYKDAVMAHQELENLKFKLETSAVRFWQLKDNLHDYDDLLAKHQQEQIRFMQIGNLRSHLNDVRELFHRDNLPAKVARYFLKSLEGRMEDTLIGFDKPFTVLKTDESLRFMVQHPDGRVCAADRLSGGQKMLLGLAFRLAVNWTWASELGLVCLDEPTAGLDGDKKFGLSAALDRFKAVSKARGLQVILITHDAGLDSICDRVIDLAQR